MTNHVERQHIQNGEHCVSIFRLGNRHFGPLPPGGRGFWRRGRNRFGARTYYRYIGNMCVSGLLRQKEGRMKEFTNNKYFVKKDEMTAIFSFIFIVS